MRANRVTTLLSKANINKMMIQANQAIIPIYQCNIKKMMIFNEVFIKTPFKDLISKINWMLYELQCIDELDNRRYTLDLVFHEMLDTDTTGLPDEYFLEIFPDLDQLRKSIRLITQSEGFQLILSCCRYFNTKQFIAKIHPKSLE